jgi:hypothetical protein
VVETVEEAAVDRTVRINTENLKPDDLVTGSERAELMVGPAGLYVDRIKQDAPTNGVWVWWKGSPYPEFFNPYWTWYVIRKES